MSDEKFKCTGEVRFVERKVASTPKAPVILLLGGEMCVTLQQKWIEVGTGKVEWRDVPVTKE
jgi:hypothetical protein